MAQAMARGRSREAQYLPGVVAPGKVQYHAVYPQRQALGALCAPACSATHL